MAYKVRWAPRAAAHLEQICNFISKDSESYSLIFAKNIMAIIESLPQFPKSGRVVPEYRDENIRERIYGNYRIVYRLKDEFIEVAAICHGAKSTLDYVNSIRENSKSMTDEEVFSDLKKWEKS